MSEVIAVMYYSILTISLAAMILIMSFTLTRSESKKRIWFLAMLASVFMFLLGTLIGVLATTTEGAFMGTRVEYVGSVFLAPVSLLFVASYCEIKIPGTVKALGLLLPAVISILLWTTESHGLIYAYFTFAEGELTGLNITPGPLHLVTHFYAGFCVIVCCIMLAHRYLTWDVKHRVVIRWLLIAALTPMLSNVLFLLRVDIQGIQVTPVTMAVTCILLWFHVIKHDLFDVVSKSMEMALQSIKEAFILIDIEDNFLHANESAKKLFPELETLKQGEQIAKVKNWPFESSKNEQIKHSVNFEMPGNNYYIANISTITERNAKMLGYIILIQDITETVLLASKALEANRSKSNFLAVMSHEIRTPMNAIIGISETHLQKENTTEEYKTALGRIHDSGINLLRIINDILDLSKIEFEKMVLSPTNYNMPDFINDTVQLNIVRIGSRQVNFTLHIDENLPLTLHGDELRLKQILNNLLSNAIKYTKEGHVKLTIDCSVQNEHAMLRFTIADTGQGIKPKDMENLFSKYMRFNAEANRTTEGTGIGLYITRNLVGLMDGTIEVDSEYGRGSTFTVTIKQKVVGSEIIGSKLAEELRNFTYSGSGQLTKLQFHREPMPYGKVLVVDDTEPNLYVAKMMLSLYDLQIETASSGFAVLEKVKNGEAYDIIFMDHVMPLMDGVETTQKLRDIMGYKGIIIALTATTAMGSDEMFKESGFDDFISKPIDTRRLDNSLKKYIRDRYPEKSEKSNNTTLKHEKAKPSELDETLAGADSLEGFKAIEGLDVDAALAALDGSHSFYIYTTEMTTRLMPKTINKMDDYMASGDVNAFKIEAHGIKTALRNIGAFGLGNEAAGLEEEASRGSINNESYQGFRDSLSQLLNKLAAVIPEEPVIEEQ